MSRPVLDATVTYRATAGPGADIGDYAVEVECPSVVGEPTAVVPAAAVRRAVGIGSLLNKACLESGAAPWSEEMVRTNGQDLFDAMLPGVTADAVRNVVATAHRSGKLARIRVRLEAEEKYLHEVPWELLYDSLADGFLSLHPSALLSRYVLQAVPISSAPVAGSLGVAALAASPAGLPALGVERDLEEVRYALGTTARVETHPHCRWDTAAALRDRDGLHVLHLAMHGGVHDKRYNLAFLDATGKADWVPGPQLVGLISGLLPDLRLVVLSACQSAEEYGLAKTLAGLNVPAVVGYRTNVRDATANQFAAAFYGELRTHPIDQAVRNARARLRGTDPTRLGWLLPILYLRTADPVIVPTGEAYRELTAFGEPQFPPANPQAPVPVAAASPPPAEAHARPGEMLVRNTNVRMGKRIIFGDLTGAGVTADPQAVKRTMTVLTEDSDIGMEIEVGSVTMTAEQLAALFRNLAAMQ